LVRFVSGPLCESACVLVQNPTVRNLLARLKCGWSGYGWNRLNRKPLLMIYCTVTSGLPPHGAYRERRLQVSLCVCVVCVWALCVLCVLCVCARCVCCVCMCLCVCFMCANWSVRGYALCLRLFITIQLVQGSLEPYIHTKYDRT